MDKNIEIIKLRKKILKEAESLKERMTELSLRIHGTPELGLMEEKAAEWLCKELLLEGFEVKKSVAGLSTAFTGKYAGNGEAPGIGFIAEYDALPEIGHGCGHNLIGPVALGAAFVLKRSLPDDMLNVKVFGTPAEENAGGKIPMLEAGLFRNTDVVMMFHAHNEDVAACPMIARLFLTMEFFGKPAHASAFPWNGVNALDAVLLAFNNINALRQHMKEEARIHGIITHGGTAANIIPEYTRAEFYVRARNTDYLNELADRVKQCAQAAAIATGCREKVETPLPAYLSDRRLESLSSAVEENMKSLGLNPEKALPPLGYGSSDFGNVSQQVPAILSFLKIAPKGVATHSRAFTEASATEEAHCAMIQAVKVMSLTALDIITNPALLKRIKSEFENSGGGFYNEWQKP